jgi:carotene biosynthesis associated membrane protein
VKRTNLALIPPALLAGHLLALAFGVVGLLVMLPHPELWASDPHAVRVFDLSMRYAGSLPIVLGAATALAYGIVAIGPRKTLLFAVAAYAISITSELVGTGTGWPFGNYAYTDFLGHKVLGRVPFTIPMSWFCMGFTSYLLGTRLAEQLGARRRTLVSLAFGAWFLTVWDLVLDPAMANDSLRIRFWIWKEAGPYFGMPIKNLVGWSLTGLVFMSVGRLLWRENVNAASLPMTIPLAIYVANLLFAMTISASVGLWAPVALALALGLIPAALVVARRSRSPAPAWRWAHGD